MMNAVRIRDSKLGSEGECKNGTNVQGREREKNGVNINVCMQKNSYEAFFETRVNLNSSNHLFFFLLLSLEVQSLFFPGE